MIERFSRAFIHDVANQYANSCDDISGSFFCRRYDLSRAVFYGLIKKSIVESIVSDNTARLIIEKAIRNVEPHGGKSRSTGYYYNLCILRKEFMFNKEEQIRWTSLYADYNGNIANFCFENFITINLMSRTVRSAIVNSYVDDIVIKKLYDKSLSIYGEETAKKLFAELLSERNKNS